MAQDRSSGSVLRVRGACPYCPRDVQDRSLVEFESIVPGPVDRRDGEDDWFHRGWPTRLVNENRPGSRPGRCRSLPGMIGVAAWSNEVVDHKKEHHRVTE